MTFFLIRRPCHSEKMMSSVQRFSSLLFSHSSCATGPRWLGCADHPFLVIHPVGDPWAQKRRRRQTRVLFIFGKDTKIFRSCEDSRLSNHFRHRQLLGSNRRHLACYFYISDISWKLTRELCRPHPAKKIIFHR